MDEIGVQLAILTHCQEFYLIQSTRHCRANSPPDTPGIQHEPTATRKVQYFHFSPFNCCLVVLRKRLVSQLVSWCLEPSQLHRVISGLIEKGVYPHPTKSRMFCLAILNQRLYNRLRVRIFSSFCFPGSSNVVFFHSSETYGEVCSEH